MINSEVRDLLQRELLDGEELLWAERTDQYTQNYHKKRFRLTPQRRRGLKWIFALGLLGLMITFNIPKGIDNWGTPIQQILYLMLFSVAMYCFIIPPVLFVLNKSVRGRVYNIGAYGLTNKRLFEFDHDMKLIRHLDASRVQHVYGMEGVAIKPMGPRGNRSYQLGLMDNNVLTINFLDRQITQARQGER